jgi:lipopolysaccharide transport protein LptA
MIPRFVLLAAAAAGIATLQAQPAASTPAAKAADPSGIGIMQKGRPKNAKTEITCKEEATFDNETGIAVFTKSVFVKDVQFNLYCDKLTVYMGKDRKGIERAEADGNVVIVQENTNDKGEKTKSIGRAGHMTVVPEKNEATLTNWPQLQQGINNHVATEQGTVMVLNRDGRLNTTGPSKTVIVEDSQGGL